jgi:NADH-quinone oxidoreductase subunit L
LHEAPWIMTGPLLVLGVLSAFGGWLNIPSIMSFFGPVGSLEHWLEPVVGESTLRVTGGHPIEMSHSTEIMLIGLAVAIAAAGIAIAYVFLKPDRLVVAKHAPAEEGFGLVLANKYYVDETYDAGVVRPTHWLSKNVLWRGLDAGIIDGALVNGSAWLARGFGWVGSRLQTGNVGAYAWVIVVGALAVIGAFSFR